MKRTRREIVDEIGCIIDLDQEPDWPHIRLMLIFLLPVWILQRIETRIYCTIGDMVMEGLPNDVRNPLIRS